MRRTGLIALALFCLCGQATAQSDGKHEQAVVAADKSPQAAPIYREFHDWVLACDNIRTCVARYAKAQDDGADGYLSVARDAGPKGAMRATLSYPAGGRVELDGRSAGRYPWVAVRRKGAGKQAVITDAAALQFVRAVKDGRELSYNAGGSVVSLDGLKAALSAMDEAQGRTGSETALVEKGTRPAISVPAAPPLPVVRAVPTKSVLADPHRFAQAVRAVKKDDLERRGCDLDVADNDLAFMPDAGRVVVFLACNVGAYNLQGVLFIAPREAPDRASLLTLPPEPGHAPGQEMEIYWNRYAPDTGWRAERATFWTRSKGRGRGDCGSRTAWTFDGKDFQLTRYDKLDRCSGGPEGDWPTLYRARLVAK